MSNKIKLNYAIILVFLSFLGCFGGNQNTKFYIYPYSSFPLKPDGETTVFVQNRSDLSVLISSDEYEEDTVSDLYRASFKIDGLEDNRSYIFRISGNYYPTLSFPFTLEESLVLIGGLDTDLYSTLTASAQADPFFVTLKTSGAGTIIGAVNPLNIGFEICGPDIDLVSLVNNSTLQPVSDPDIAFFFFSKTGGLSTFFKTGFEDFIFFNVPEGSYKIKYVMSSASETFYSDVVVVKNNVSFGFQVPCQTFREFRSAYK